MNKAIHSKLGILLGSLAFWLGLDILSKYWAATADVFWIVFIKKYFFLTLHRNEGVAFGFHFGEWPQIIVSAFLIGALAIFAIQELSRNQSNEFFGLLGIVLGGALGNFFNRLFLGYVIDFIYLWPIPVFNVADIGITLGLITLCLLSLKKVEIK